MNCLQYICGGGLLSSDMDMISQLSGQFKSNLANGRVGSYLNQTDADIPSDLMEKFKPIMEGGETTIIPRDFFVKYYGSNEELDRQIAFAKEAEKADIAQNGKDKWMFMQHQNIDNPVNVKIDFGDSQYDGMERKANIEPLKYQMYDTESKNRWMDTETSIENAKINRYIPSDFEFYKNNPYIHFFDILEHEAVGHATTEGNIWASDFAKNESDQTHMTKSVELANSLGRVQREAFQRFGKRFSRSEFDQYLDSQKDLPEDKQFNDFGIDARRGLREIIDSYTGKKDKRLYEQSRKEIPFFVQNQYSKALESA
jgi:hypothetical protein